MTTILKSIKDADSMPVKSKVQEIKKTQELKEKDTIDVKFSTTKLTSWFDKNCSVFENIYPVKIVIRGVDPNKTLIFTIKDGDKIAEDGNEARLLKVFENADKIKVINRPAEAMNVYNNGFQIIYKLEDDVYMKTYYNKNGIVCFICKKLNDVLIPYYIKKFSKREMSDINISYVKHSDEKFNEYLNKKADLEVIQISYNQSAKELDKFSDNRSVVDWLIARQADIVDALHQIQIDSASVYLLMI